MFIDYPHQNKILDGEHDFIIKSLANISILRKEFLVLNFLHKYSFVPNVHNLKSNSFLEEKLAGKEMTKSDLTDHNIKELAHILKKLHALNIPPNIKRLIHNDYLLNNHYQPILIMQTIIEKSPAGIIRKYGNFMTDIAKELQTQLKHKKYQISLIHGDLSYHNIFLQDANIFLIDWSDCRLDISSCDVSQLFYLLNFSEIQEKLFLKHYQIGYIDSQILKFHKALLLMYDLADSNIKKLKINKNKMKKLDLLCSHFYD